MENANFAGGAGRDGAGLVGTLGSMSSSRSGSDSCYVVLATGGAEDE